MLFSLLDFTQYSASCFLCFFECTMPVIITFVDHKTWVHSCFVLAQDRVPLLCILFTLEVPPFVTKHAHSMLACAFLDLQQQNTAEHYVEHYFVAARSSHFTYSSGQKRTTKIRRRSLIRAPRDNMHLLSIDCPLCCCAPREFQGRLAPCVPRSASQTLACLARPAKHSRASLGQPCQTPIGPRALSRSRCPLALWHGPAPTAAGQTALPLPSPSAAGDRAAGHAAQSG